MRSHLQLVRSNRYNGVTGVTSWHPPVGTSAPSVGAPTPATPATPAVSGPAAATLSATLVSVDAPAAKPAAAVAAAVASAPSKGSLGIAAQLMRSKKAKEAHELSKAKEKSDGPDLIASTRRLPRPVRSYAEGKIVHGVQGGSRESTSRIFGGSARPAPRLGPAVSLKPPRQIESCCSPRMYGKLVEQPHQCR